VTEQQHYFSSDPHADAKQHTVAFSVGQREFRLAAAPGVFSASRLDPGTAVLLRKAPLPTGDGTYLDLGCGWGPVSVALASFSSGTVHAVDVNSRALELVAANAKRLDLGDRILPSTPDDIPEGLEFDEIWSNPPIRVGKEALHELLAAWLPRLRPDGTAWLVVARHKGADSLVPWIADRGFAVVKHASQKGFRVLRVRRS
jgi:16S rRNA G1207 methylase RsmC